jgi:hypothetical protein
LDIENKVAESKLPSNAKELWIQVSLALASHSSASSDAAVNWANKITDAYEKRFGKDTNDYK